MTGSNKTSHKLINPRGAIFFILLLTFVSGCATIRANLFEIFRESGLCPPKERNSQAVRKKDSDRKTRDLWRNPHAGAEGARRKPNLSGKRTEHFILLSGCAAFRFVFAFLIYESIHRSGCSHFLFTEGDLLWKLF